ncbi:YbaB/EbfC family DNA-binding protein [Mycobacterium sp. MMS18-G62]
MTGDVPWDDDDDALEFAAPRDYDEASALDVIAEYSPILDQGDDRPLAALFTVTNPAGTVSATAMIGGRLHRVDLSANAADMTEAQLADEIVVLAGLAAEKAQAAQHAVIVQLMRTMGHDSVMTSGYIEHDLGLPSPQTAEARRANVFAARYALHDEA